MTFIGYQMPFFAMVLVLALLLYAMQEYVSAQASPGTEVSIHGTSSNGSRPWTLPLTAAMATVVGCLVFDLSWMIPAQRMYSGRDGVIVIRDNGDLIWDGLWHSKLARNDNHIGTNNWMLAVCPVTCHPTGKIEDVCVIGMGTGITAGTLAKLQAVKQVDGYEISTVLDQIYRAYPAGTLDLLNNDKIHLIWQDARTGLALSSKQYDLIQAQPLYLKQAGSSLLNSVEFFQLVKQRLKPGGVFCLYSNGTAEQAFSVRETADRVFPHRVSFFDGYLVILSDNPIVLDEQTLSNRLASGDRLWDEIRNYPPTSTAKKIVSLVDFPNLLAGDGTFVITDDCPLVEYPELLSRRVQQSLDQLLLPTPNPVITPVLTPQSTMQPVPAANSF
jgi:spermidine synthase